MATMLDERSDDREGLAAAWAACTKTSSSGPLAGPRLARALLHAASLGLCRTARHPLDEADPQMVQAARVFCLLQIALRSGSYDPELAGERQIWATLRQRLPAGWAEALADAAAAGRRAAKARGTMADRPTRGASLQARRLPAERSGRRSDSAGGV